MNFNYSYKAFLITALLVGNLYLLLYSVKLTKINPLEEQSYEIEYALEEPLPEEEMEETKVTSTQKIETHKAYNEAEKFIKELEAEDSESTQNKLAQMDQAMQDTNLYKTTFTKPKPNKENKEEKVQNGTNKNTTNSYFLVDRDVLYFPNPVYICEGFGTVVLFIEVNKLGKVVTVSVNEAASNTQDLCLREAAINYAKKARFNGDKNKPLQKGSITYIFPGQQ